MSKLHPQSWFLTEWAMASALQDSKCSKCSRTFCDDKKQVWRVCRSLSQNCMKVTSCDITAMSVTSSIIRPNEFALRAFSRIDSLTVSPIHMKISLTDPWDLFHTKERSKYSIFQNAFKYHILRHINMFLAHLSICSGWAFVIALRPSSSVRPASVRRLFTFSNDISSETTGLFPSKLCLQHQCGEQNIVKSYLLELFPLLPWQPGTKILKNLLLRDR